MEHHGIEPFHDVARPDRESLDADLKANDGDAVNRQGLSKLRMVVGMSEWKLVGCNSESIGVNSVSTCASLSRGRLHPETLMGRHPCLAIQLVTSDKSGARSLYLRSATSR